MEDVDGNAKNVIRAAITQRVARPRGNCMVRNRNEQKMRSVMLEILAGCVTTQTEQRMQSRPEILMRLKNQPHSQRGHCPI